jgi:hypothetical protein
MIGEWSIGDGVHHEYGMAIRGNLIFFLTCFLEEAVEGSYLGPNALDNRWNNVGFGSIRAILGVRSAIRGLPRDKAVAKP